MWCLRLSSQRNFSVAVAPTHLTAAYHRSTCPTAPLKSSPPFVIAGVSLSVAAITSVRPCHPSLLMFIEKIDLEPSRHDSSSVSGKQPFQQTAFSCYEPNYELRDLSSFEQIDDIFVYKRNLWD
ncbi:hypothetical protein PIB30_055281 [Stylosanthes scabra]|uniref:Uncharacterized protein n=1 Tax=Stylosanthes scabra TaxID=79078 RepID=A0ABU6ULD4_9FABA|nr:hypothetical protein [Stylosanthes scabra]